MRAGNALARRQAHNGMHAWGPEPGDDMAREVPGDPAHSPMPGMTMLCRTLR